VNARVLTLVVALLACSPGTETTAGVEGAACELPSATVACGACAKSACCAEIAACTGACRTFHACTALCAAADDACLAACRVANPTGFDANAAALASCLASRCEAPCETGCGGYVVGRTSCNACIDRSCCAPQHDCMTNRECAVLVACERACAPTDGLCLGECERAHPSARELARAFGACVETSCRTDCVPFRWRCLEQKTPSPQLSPAATTLVTLRLQDLIPRRLPLVGATVVACGAGALTACDPLSRTETSDANGTVILEVPTNFWGYFEVKRSDLDALVYLPPILAEWSGEIPLLTTGGLATVAALAGTTLDDSRGHLLLEAKGCFLVDGTGVRFNSPSPSAVGPMYVAGTSLDLRATETATSGLGGFLNVPTDPALHVSATVAQFDLPMPTFNVRIEPKRLTYARVHAQR